MALFRHTTTLKLRDTDAAGVAFFGAYYSIAHDVYESYLASRGVSLAQWLNEIHLPIVHSEAIYTAPIRLGDRFEVHLSCSRLGTSSFTLSYRFLQGERSLAQLKTVHVAVDQQSSPPKSLPLPTSISEQISPLMEVEDQVSDLEKP